MLALIFPGKTALLPYIGPALAATRLGQSFLKGVPGAGGVGFCGGQLTKRVAKSDEVRLRAAFFTKVGLFPVGNEVGNAGRHMATLLSSVIVVIIADSLIGLS